MPSGKSSASAAPERKAEAPRLAAPAPAPAPAVRKAAAPAPAAAQNDSAVRLGRTEVPSNIPNLGGRRPKQAHAVQAFKLCTLNDCLVYPCMRLEARTLVLENCDAAPALIVKTHLGAGSLRMCWAFLSWQLSTLCFLLVRLYAPATNW